MIELEEFLTRLEAFSPDQKQKVFQAIRSSISIHELEKEFGTTAEIILGAIYRGTDLTKRGVRGLIAETVFVDAILPKVDGWASNELIGNLAYDALLTQGNKSVRVQVKLQRKKAGAPFISKGSYIVEVQKTRSGEKDGSDTRPYKFTDFDLLAVSMEPSTKNWASFMYIPSELLVPRRLDSNLIDIMQPIAPFPEGDDRWTSDIKVALERC